MMWSERRGTERKKKSTYNNKVDKLGCSHADGRMLCKKLTTPKALTTNVTYILPFFTVIQSQWSIACGCKECASALSRHHLHNIVSSIVCVFFFKESRATNLDGKRSIIHHHLFIGNARRLKEVVWVCERDREKEHQYVAAAIGSIVIAQ